MGVLTIFLEKVDNLRDGDLIGKSDPYVVFELKEDNFVLDKHFGKQESSHKSNVLSPVYNETFHFSDIPSLNKMLLTVKVMDDDFGDDDKLGSCKIKLENLGLTTTPKHVEQAVDRKLFRSNAVIHLKLSYSG